MRKKLFLFISALIHLFVVSVSAQNKHCRILFVGNSLTYSNDLPSIVAELAALDSIKLIHKSFTFPDYALEDHWNEGRVEDEIENGNYDFVVFQQGPSALDASRVLLIDYVLKFAAVCKKAKAIPVDSKNLDNKNIRKLSFMEDIPASTQKILLEAIAKAIGE